MRKTAHFSAHDNKEKERAFLKKAVWCNSCPVFRERCVCVCVKEPRLVLDVMWLASDTFHTKLGDANSYIHEASSISTFHKALTVKIQPDEGEEEGGLYGSRRASVTTCFLTYLDYKMFAQLSMSCSRVTSKLHEFWFDITNEGNCVSILGSHMKVTQVWI